MVTTTAVQELVARPRRATLRDGTEVTLRPMLLTDERALLRFFQRVPAHDRYYLKEDVTSPKVIERWAKELDYDRALPLLAFVGDEVVADGTLHRRKAEARRHIGEIRIVVDPKYRNVGLGTHILHELLSIARNYGLERAFLELVADREGAAMKAAEWWGFTKVAVLPGHAKDLDGAVHDVVLLEMPLDAWFEGWPF